MFAVGVVYGVKFRELREEGWYCEKATDVALAVAEYTESSSLVLLQHVMRMYPTRNTVRKPS